MKTFSIVVAVENSNGIGLKGGMPWPRLSKDMAHFQKVTSTTNCGEGDSYNKNIRNAIIMGRKTWDSIPSHLRPLKNRLNIILTHNKELLQERQENEIWVASLQSALDTVQNDKSIDKIFVIGGGQLYREAMKHVLCESLYITRIYADFEHDTTFPLIRPEQFREEFVKDSAHTEHDIQYQFKLYKRLPPVHEEYQYLDMIREVIASGNDKSDRTGVGTISVFGRQMRFNLRNGSFPLLTTKRVFWRGVAEELLWFVAGTTNGKLLQEKKIHIWDGNGSRQYLDSIGLRDREEMDLGPVYGFQWRHWGAKYENMHTDYTNRGIDQLAECIHKIKNNPTDRRIIMTAWNPSDLKEMALPPCHMFCQFYVADGELSCQMYQRSCDMGLGVPFNIASYSLLTYMVAHVCGLKPGEFVHVLGDTHVYKNHVKPLEEQLTRKPRPFPTLKITRNVTSIDDFKFEDFELTGYDCHGPIKMDMAV